MAGFGLTGISLGNKVSCETSNGIIQGTVVSIGSTHNAAEKVIPILSVKYMADEILLTLSFVERMRFQKLQ